LVILHPVCLTALVEQKTARLRLIEQAAQALIAGDGIDDQREHVDVEALVRALRTT